MPVLTSDEALEIYESMQCSESEGDDWYVSLVLLLNSTVTNADAWTARGQ